MFVNNFSLRFGLFKSRFDRNQKSVRSKTRVSLIKEKSQFDRRQESVRSKTRVSSIEEQMIIKTTV